MLTLVPTNECPNSSIISVNDFPFNSPFATIPVPFGWQAISQLSPISPSGKFVLNSSKSLPPHILS